MCFSQRGVTLEIFPCSNLRLFPVTRGLGAWTEVGWQSSSKAKANSLATRAEASAALGDAPRACCKADKPKGIIYLQSQGVEQFPSVPCKWHQESLSQEDDDVINFSDHISHCPSPPRFFPPLARQLIHMRNFLLHFPKDISKGEKYIPDTLAACSLFLLCYKRNHSTGHRTAPCPKIPNLHSRGFSLLCFLFKSF